MKRIRGLQSLPTMSKRLFILGPLVVAMTFTLAIGPVVGSEPLQITVYGASGRVGSHIVREALNRGHHVTGIGRDPSKIKQEHERLSVKAGDITEPESVATTIRGHDLVIVSVGERPTNDDPRQHVVFRAAQSTVTALRSLGEEAPRVIMVGGAASLEIRPGVLMVEDELLWQEMNVPPDGPRALLMATAMAHKLALDHFRAAPDVDWTVASLPSRIARNKGRTGHFRLGGDQAVRTDTGELSEISFEDFAVAVIDEAEQARHSHARFTVAY